MQVKLYLVYDHESSSLEGIGHYQLKLVDCSVVPVYFTTTYFQKSIAVLLLVLLTNTILYWLQNNEKFLIL